MTKKLLPLVALFIIGLQAAKAQFIFTDSIYNQYNTPVKAISTCDSFKVAFTITNTGGNLTLPDTFKIELPDNTGINGSVFTYSSNDGATLGHSFTHRSEPWFILTSTTSGSWNVGDAIRIIFKLRTPCCVANNDTGFITIKIDTSLSTSSSSKSLIVEMPDPYISCPYPGNDSNLIENIGDVNDLVFRVKNAGSLAIQQDVAINCPSLGSIKMLGYFFSTDSTKTTQKGKNWCSYDTTGYHFVPGSFSYVIADTNVYLRFFAKDNFPAGDSLFFHIFYQTDSCERADDSIRFRLYCMESDVYCNPGTPISVFNSVHAGNPSITATPLAPVYQNLTYSNYCDFGQPAVKLGFKFANNGTDISGPNHGNAYATNLKLVFYTSNEWGTIAADSFRINGVLLPYLPAGFLTKTLLKSTYKNNPLWFTQWTMDFTKWRWGCDSSLYFGNITDINGYGALDCLSNLSGENSFTVTTTFTYQPESDTAHTSPFCPASFLNSCGDSYDVPLGVKIYYDNQCGIVDSNSSATTTNGLAYLYNVNSAANSTLTNPEGNDLTDTATVPYYLEVCPGAYSQSWTDTAYTMKCPHADDRITLYLPAGYQINYSDTMFVSSANHHFKHALLLTSSEGCSPQYVTPYVSENIACDSGKAYIDFGLLPTCNFDGASFTYNIGCFMLPLKLVCNSCMTHSSWDYLHYELGYYCDTGSCTCASPITCGSDQIQHHCHGTCASGNDFTTFSPFTFQRQTLGWVDTISAHYYDCVNIPRTNAKNSLLNPLRLDRAYPGDEVLAIDSGALDNALSHYDTIIFQVNYSTAFWGAGTYADAFIFNFDSSKSWIRVTDALGHSTHIRYPSLQHAPDRISSSDYVKMCFTFATADSTTDTLAGMKPPYQFSSHIYLFAKSKPILSTPLTFFNWGQYPLTYLEAEYRGKVHSFPHDTDNSCDGWTATMSILQPALYYGFNPDGSNSCGLDSVEFRFGTKGALWPNENDFPHEFRPYSSLNAPITLHYPAGLNYLYSKFSIAQDSFNISGPNHFGIDDTVVGHYYPITGTSGLNSVTYTGLSDACWPLIDCKGMGLPNVPYYSIFMYFQPSCGMADSADFTTTTGFTTSIQQPDTAYLVHISLTPDNYLVYHENPSLSIAPPSTTNVCTDTVKFTVTLTNTSAYNAPYPWIAFAQTSSHPKIIVRSVTDSVYSKVYGAQSRFVMLQPLSAGGSVNLMITCIVDSAYGCVASATTDTIGILCGNECSNSPIITKPDESKGCKFDSLGYQFNLYPSALYLNQIGIAHSVSAICGDVLTDTLEIENGGQNTLTSPGFSMNLPAGITLDSVAYIYPGVSGGKRRSFSKGDNHADTGNLSWNLVRDSVIKNNRLPGTCTASGGNNNVLAIMYLQTNCSYNNAPTSMVFNSSALTFCKQTINSGTITYTPSGLVSSCPKVKDSVITNVACYSQSNGSATLVATGGTSPYAYLWIPTGITTATATGLSAGTYTTKVTDVHGCVVTSLVTITQPILLTVVVSGHATCFGVSSGSASATASGGTTPYTYFWSNSQTNATATGLAAGSYTITVTDADGCIATASVSITMDPALTATLTGIVNISCFGGTNGAATLNASGGTTPYTYAWNPGGNTHATATGLSAGTYTATLTDANGCTATATVTLTQPSPFTARSTFATEVSCFGGSNGSTTVTPLGGVSPYTYLWSNGKTTSHLTGLTAGGYTVTATDSHGCTASTSITLTQPPALKDSLSGTVSLR